MEKCIITMGDFLKNAGIVGLVYTLEHTGAIRDTDYGITDDEQSLWLSKEFAINADWTDLYFKAFVKCFGPSTVYQRVLDKIKLCLDKMDSQTWKTEKTEKDDLKFINEKLMSNSYQAGFANIQDKIEHPEVYMELKTNKLNDKMGEETLRVRLVQLQEFLKQPLCHETFAMKSIIYTYINRFWDGKCFLLRANAKKDMRELFENEFSKPFREYWQADHAKAKDLCIDCGMPMGSKEKVSIAFMKEMADDLSRKRSAFWNCKVDAYLCPTCALIYALSPLGFQLYANKFVFVNINQSLRDLLNTNNKERGELFKSDKEETEKYTAWFARMLNTVLQKKQEELKNVQVVLRGIQSEDRYIFSIIGKDALQVLAKEKVGEALKYLSQHPFVKMNGDFINVHEAVIMNILQYRSQYALLHKLMKAAIETEGISSTAFWVYIVQLWSAITRRQEENEGAVAMSRIAMRNSGYALRKAIMVAKKTENDDCLRGVVYQLLNALSVKNQEKFMDIVIRAYSSTNLLMPDGFVYMLGDKEEFMEYGYAFLLGLKGAHPDNRKTENKEEDQ